MTRIASLPVDQWDNELRELAQPDTLPSSSRRCSGSMTNNLTRTAHFYKAPMTRAITPFHIAVQVRDITEARNFYGRILGCAEGRSDAHWVDFNLFGHQVVCHLDPSLGTHGKVNSHSNPVDGHAVPVPHFGVVLEIADWDLLAKRLQHERVNFLVEPYTRFRGEAGEQSTMFFLDPSGNALEFKAFQDIENQLFAT